MIAPFSGVLKCILVLSSLEKQSLNTCWALNIYVAPKIGFTAPITSVIFTVLLAVSLLRVPRATPSPISIHVPFLYKILCGQIIKTPTWAWIWLISLLPNRLNATSTFTFLTFFGLIEFPKIITQLQNLVFSLEWIYVKSILPINVPKMTWVPCLMSRLLLNSIYSYKYFDIDLVVVVIKTIL